MKKIMILVFLASFPLVQGIEEQGSTTLHCVSDQVYQTGISLAVTFVPWILLALACVLGIVLYLFYEGL